MLAQPIDRHALVSRHDVRLTKVDPSAPLMVGNGQIGFTADITGLQTFPEAYSPIAPLLTEAQWAWHSFPNPNGYTYADGTAPIDVRGTKQPYAYMKDWNEPATRPALAWLRENPHRFSLGRVALDLRSKTGQPATFADITQTDQTLDLWTGVLTSRFVYDGEAVTVRTRVHPTLDMIVVDVDSALVAQGRLSLSVKFPGVSKSLNPDPSDWTRPRPATPPRCTGEGRQDPEPLPARSTRPATSPRCRPTRRSASRPTGRMPSRWRPRPRGARWAWRSPSPAPRRRPCRPWRPPTRPCATTGRPIGTKARRSTFTGSTDPRAAELERRVVLSQYLMALNGAGEVPPQEEGLFSNSWNGKFHLEMHPWHAGHFALWNRPEHARAQPALVSGPPEGRRGRAPPATA